MLGFRSLGGEESLEVGGQFSRDGHGRGLLLFVLLFSDESSHHFLVRPLVRTFPILLLFPPTRGPPLDFRGGQGTPGGSPGSRLGSRGIAVLVLGHRERGQC
jgi:hypothetical protein